MAGGISSIYHTTSRLKAVNKLTLAGVSFSKKRNGPLNNKKWHRSRIEKSRQAFAPRPVESVRKKLGPFDALHIDKIGIKQQTVKESKDYLKCQIYLMCNKRWYSLAELISVGFLGGEWRCYSGMLESTARRKGIIRLREKYGLMLDVVSMRKKTL